MKRESFNSPKLKHLRRLLGGTLREAIGALELLWHLARESAPAGDVGKFSDAQIAEALDYDGALGEEVVKALVDSGFLDEDPVCRLRIHDWADHAEDYVHRKIARSREFFACGCVPKRTRLSGKERQALEEFYADYPERCPEHAVRTPGAPPSRSRPSPARPNQAVSETAGYTDWLLERIFGVVDDQRSEDSVMYFRDLVERMLQHDLGAALEEFIENLERAADPVQREMKGIGRFTNPGKWLTKQCAAELHRVNEKAPPIPKSMSDEPAVSPGIAKASRMVTASSRGGEPDHILAHVDQVLRASGGAQ